MICHSQIVLEEENNRIVIRRNTDTVCEYKDSIVETYIHIQSYNYINPIGHMGILHDPDLPVIYDSKFTITIEFPLHNPVDVTVSNNDARFTLRELLQIIKMLYEKVYDEEEESASENTFEISSECVCVENPLGNSIIDADAVDDQCSICYSELDTDVGKLGCDHIFHKSCLQKWIDTGRGISCPLCRANMSACGDCGGSQVVTRQHTSVVLPMEYRESSNRNETDGVYGIYGFDLENLVIEELIYNRFEKKLKVYISII